MQNNIQYFIIVDGRQKGPYPREVLVMQGMTPETFVWREGMSGWEKASSMPELGDLFVEESAFGTYAEPQQTPYGQPPYGQQPPYGRQPQYPQQPQPPYGQYPPYGQQQPEYNIPHTNWMPWAITATVINCFSNCIGLIFSIIGIVQANKANNLYQQGLTGPAESANSTARTMTILGLVFAVIGILAAVVMVATGILSELAGSGIYD